MSAGSTAELKAEPSILLPQQVAAPGEPISGSTDGLFKVTLEDEIFQITQITKEFEKLH